MSSPARDRQHGVRGGGAAAERRRRAAGGPGARTGAGDYAPSTWRHGGCNGIAAADDGRPRARDRRRGQDGGTREEGARTGTDSRRKRSRRVQQQHRRSAGAPGTAHAHAYATRDPLSPVYPNGLCTSTCALALWPQIRRMGVLAVKKGMLQMWDAWGVRMPITVLQVRRRPRPG